MNLPLDRNIRVAVLGCGHWGGNYIRVFNELAGCEVVAVCDQRPQRLQVFEAACPDALFTTDIDEILNADIDAVVVATQASTHFVLARRCLDANKHLLIEKPLTTVSEHALELTEQARERGVTLMVGHTFVYNPAVQRLKRYASDGELGEIYYLYSQRTNLGPIRSDVNALWDLASHDISIFNYLLDDVPEWVSAVGARVLRNEREDVGFVSLGYSDGVVGHVHVSWADPNKAREMVVVGSEKRARFNDLDGLEKIRLYEKSVRAVPDGLQTFGEAHFEMRDGPIVSPSVPTAEPLKNQCSHFLDCVVTGRRPITAGAEGEDVIHVLEAIDRSLAQQGGKVAVLSPRAGVQQKRQIAAAQTIITGEKVNGYHGAVR